MIPEDEENSLTESRFDEKQLRHFVKKLYELDANRFLNILYMMTSTVKNYRSSEILFLTLVKTIPLTKLMEMDKHFTLISSKRNDI